jgi:hypothetical protein
MVFTDPPFDLDYDFLEMCFLVCDKHIFFMHSDKNHCRLASKHFDNFDVFYVIYFDAPTWNLNKVIPLTQHVLISHYKGSCAQNYELDMLHSVIHLTTKNEKAVGEYMAKRIESIAPFVSNFSREGEIIFDCFGGAGSTLIACEQLARNCYVLEIGKAMTDVIVRRWMSLTGEEARVERAGKVLSFYDLQKSA